MYIYIYMSYIYIYISTNISATSFGSRFKSEASPLPTPHLRRDAGASSGAAFFREGGEVGEVSWGEKT